MRAKPLTRVVVLVVTSFIIGVLIFGAHGYQLSRMERSVLSRAAQAEKDGDFREAERLYREHLDLVPNDRDAKLKHADVLLKGSENFNYQELVARQELATQAYSELLNSPTGDHESLRPHREIRRRLAELLVELRHYVEARQSLEILLQAESEDGALHFLMGLCQEESDEPRRAVASYKSAISYHAPQRLEAYQRQAILLLTQLERPDEAERVINEMVNSQPEDYRVHLEHGRYLRRFGRYLPRFKKTPEAALKAAKEDLERALKQKPSEPAIYLELAETEIAQVPPNLDKAHRILDDGLKIMPSESSLHRALALLEELAGRRDKAIESIRHSLQKLPDQVILHWALARLLAERGDTTDLLAEIEELKRLNLNNLIVRYIEAHYHVNLSNWTKARDSLIKLQADVAGWPDFKPVMSERDEFLVDFKAQVINLLAQCHGHLGDSERQRDAYRRAVRANPKLQAARLGLANTMIERGEIDQAIDEYRKLIGQFPQAAGRLVYLLIARNLQQPPAQRDWTEVDQLIKKVIQGSAPEANEWVLLQVEKLLAQDKIGEAQALLDEARSRSPGTVGLWIKASDLLRRQRKFTEAQTLLKQAQKAAGDSVDLRVEQAHLLIAEGRADVSAALKRIAQDSASFKHGEHRRLLEALAGAAVQANDIALATNLWEEVTKLDPADIAPQLRLLELAYRAAETSALPKVKDARAIENRLDEIKAIEGADGTIVQQQEVLHRLWQVQNTVDALEQAKLRNSTRLLIDALRSRHPDSPLVPFALAQLAEQESSQADLNGDKRRKAKDEAATYYIRAIELGQTHLPVIRHCIDLLYELGRADEVTQLRDRIPSALLPSLNFQSQANETEAALRKAIDSARAEPNRWLALVQFLTQTKQMKKAEEALGQAEQVLKDRSAEEALGLAQCCEIVGQSYRMSRQDEEKTKTWYAKANEWYRKARGMKPSDPTIMRGVVEYLLRTRQLQDAAGQLTAILETSGTDPKRTAETAWARRRLAQVLLSSNDDRQRSKALTLVGPIIRDIEGQEAANQAGKNVEDMRLVARVYQAQKTTTYHVKARAILEKLTAANLANTEDRFLLALMYGNDGEWAKAHDQYRQLLTQAENTRDPEVLGRRPDYIAQFIIDLLKHFQSAQEQQDLSEAQELINKLRAISPGNLGAVVLEGQIYKAQRRIDKVVELIEDYAKRPNPPPLTLQVLAKMAEEEANRPELSEQLLRQLVKQADQAQNRFALAIFLSRYGRVKEALDACEPLWQGGTNVEAFIRETINVLFKLPGKRDRSQIDRVADWLQRGLEQKPNSSILMIGLASLRDHQERYPEAEALYRQAINQDGENYIPLNNLAFLIALQNGAPGGALDLINRAIKRGGPLPELLDTRGYIYIKSGDSQHALEDLEKACSLDPSGPKYLHLAQAYILANNKKAASEAFTKARSTGLKPEILHTLETPAYNDTLNALKDEVK
jgi:tetratricopeptide (TPR) repeat protein